MTTAERHARWAELEALAPARAARQAAENAKEAAEAAVRHAAEDAAVPPGVVPLIYGGDSNGGVIGVAAGEHRGEGLRHPTVGTLRLYEEVLGRPFPVRARGLGYLGGAVEVHGTATVTAEEYARLRAGFGGRQ